MSSHDVKDILFVREEENLKAYYSVRLHARREKKRKSAFTCFTHNLMKPQVTSSDTSYI